MHFIIMNGTIECPACGLQLRKVGEQDKRVHYMVHPETAFCSCSSKKLRIDRYNGFGEVMANA